MKHYLNLEQETENNLQYCKKYSSYIKKKLRKKDRVRQTTEHGKEEKLTTEETRQIHQR